MKKINCLLAAIILFASCTSVKVEGNEEAVLIAKPIIFGHGGVDDESVKPGQSWAAITTDYVTFSVVPETYTDSIDKLMTKDNTPVTVIAFLKLQVRKGTTPVLYKNFGVEWFHNSISPTFYSMIRDKASAYKMFELTSDREILAGLEKDLFTEITNYCKNINIPIDVLQVTIGRVTPPEEVLEETRRTAAQNQSKLTQDARAGAELARKQAEINKAIADQAYKVQMGMTINEYLQLRNLEIEKEKIELVRDKQNVTIVMGQGLTPMIPIK